MVKLSISIPELHPSIITALGERCDHEAILAEINETIDEGSGALEQSGNIRDKVKKDHIAISASGKLSGIKLPKDSPAALLARVHWYLSGSREYFVRVEQVELPKSVMDWASAEKFQLDDAAFAIRQAETVAKLEAARVAAEAAKAKREAKAAAKATAGK